MEVNTREVSFHQIQTVYVESVFTPVLAATSYLVQEWLAIYTISNLLFYYNSNQLMHTFFSKSQWNYLTTSTTCFRTYCCIIRGHTIIPNSWVVLRVAELPSAHVLSYITLRQTVPRREPGNKEEKSSDYITGVF